MSNISTPVGRRTVLKAGIALGASQVIGAPYRAQGARRRAGQDRHGQSADRRAVGAGAKRGRRRQIRRRRNQQEGRHSRPPGPAPGRGFGQRRRHRRAEDAQADRSRSGRRDPRRRQFRHRLRDVAGDHREESLPYRAGRPYRPDHRHQLQMERVPRLQHHVDGRQRGHARTGQEVRQEVVLHHARLRLRPHAAGCVRQGADQARRQPTKATCCRSTTPISPPP